MSFSKTVKEELSNKYGSALHCQIAEITAILQYCGRVEMNEEGKYRLDFQTENEAVARKYFTLLRKTFNINTEIVIQKQQGLKGSVYIVHIASEQKTLELLESTKLLSSVKAGCLNTCTADSLVLKKNCCKRAYMRGLFLVAGSISDPEKGYHFEIVSVSEQRAKQLRDLIRSFHIDAKIVLRKKVYVVYVKEGEQIVELLGLMEANVSLFNLENIRIIKEMRNTINRKVNCETANLNKVIEASCKQKADILLIDQEIGIGNISESLREVAILRLQFPDASLKEIGDMLSPPVGKSGVNHRLRKLSIMAKELRDSKEEDCYD